MAATATAVPTARKRAKFFKGEHLDLSKRVCFLGATMSGKTRGLYDFMMMANARHIEKFGHGIQIAFGFSSTENGNGNLGGPVINNQGKLLSQFSIMPSMFAMHGFSKQRLEDIMTYQMKTKNAKRGKECMIVFDDVFNENGMNRNTTLDKLAQNGRNGMMGMYVSGHKMKQMGTGVRSSMHYVVVYDLEKSELGDFHTQFAAELFDTKQELWDWWMLLRRRKGKYWSMVIDVKNIANSSKFEDRVFVFRSRDPSAPDYFIPHFCEKGFWWLQKHLERRGETQVDVDALFDFGRITASRNIDVGRANAKALDKAARDRDQERKRATLLAPSVLGGTTSQVGGDHAEFLDFP